MSPVSEKEQHHQVLLHFWNQGVHTAKELHNLTNISLRTIYYNIKKLEKKGHLTIEVVDQRRLLRQVREY